MQALRLMGAAIAACLLQAAGCSSIPDAPDQAAATASPDTQALALACTSCHAASPGSEAGRALPELYGRRAKSLEQQLLGYKRGTRKGTLMPRIARAYSEQELSELADYFANARATR